MSANGLEVFDRTVQVTNVWLDEIMEATGTERRAAWQVLGAVLRAIRDQLPVDHSAHLSAQLPLMVRGTFYDQWRPADVPDKIRDREAFLERVAAGLSGNEAVDVERAARAVMATLERNIDPGEARKVKESLHHDIRALWPETQPAE